MADPNTPRPEISKLEERAKDGVSMFKTFAFGACAGALLTASAHLFIGLQECGATKSILSNVQILTDYATCLAYAGMGTGFAFAAYREARKP